MRCESFTKVAGAPNDVILPRNHGASELPKILKPKATTKVTITSHQCVGVRLQQSLVYSGVCAFGKFYCTVECLRVTTLTVSFLYSNISINIYLQSLVQL